MKIQARSDGSFVFVFGANEKALGIQILESIVPYTEEGAVAIEQAILEVRYAGVELPDNVVPIH